VDYSSRFARQTPILICPRPVMPLCLPHGIEISRHGNGTARNKIICFVIGTCYQGISFLRRCQLLLLHGIRQRQLSARDGITTKDYARDDTFESFVQCAISKSRLGRSLACVCIMYYVYVYVYVWKKSMATTKTKRPGRKLDTLI